MLFVVKGKEWYFDRECRFKDERDKTGNQNYRDREDVWEIKRSYQTGKMKNANTQPIELVEKALKYITSPKSIILDPFMGGATTAIACMNLDRQYIGFEVNKNLEEYIENRLQRENKDGTNN